VKLPDREVRMGMVRDMVYGPMCATLMRFTRECGTIFMALGSFKHPEKEGFHGSRGWFGDLTVDGRSLDVRDLVNTIMVQHFQHHYPLAPGDLTGAVRELAAWLGIGFLDAVPYKPYLQRST